MSQARVPPLFEVLPEGLFSPLASGNKRQYWAVLCGLFRARFGPDAPAAPIDGFPKADIVRDIGNVLSTFEGWVVEDGEPDSAATPLDVRANNVFTQLERCGWFVSERIGIRERVSMRPAVSEFLARLTDFVERGPVFLGAEVRSIALQLKDVLSNGGPPSSFQKSACDSRAILNHLAATRLQIRDVMAEINKVTSIADFARRFFSDYVKRLFIADYSELKLKNHPLARRGEILDLAGQIGADEPCRARLLAWYHKELAANDEGLAVELFERDMRRILDLEKIDGHLNRLDDEFHSANRRAIAYVNYRIQAPKDLDRLLSLSIQALNDDPTTLLDVPLPASEMISEERLQEPRLEPVPIARESIGLLLPDERQVAIANLARRFLDSRQVTARKVAAYLARHMRDREDIGCEDLSVDSVEDFRIYQALLFAGMLPPDGGATSNPMSAVVGTAQVRLQSGTTFSNGKIRSPRFSISRRQRTFSPRRAA